MPTVPPHQSAPDETWLSRVQSLLAKAESTDFPEEAEALVAKAQDLMARHAITDAMLARSSGTSTAVGTRTVTVPPPYVSAKASLLGAVALANGCRCVSTGTGSGAGTCVLVGYEGDLTNVETLFASLTLQAVRSMLAAPVPAGDTARRFRHAFLLAFAARVGQRLHQTASRVRVEVETAEGPGAAVVLADRAAAVDSAMREAFPRLRTARYSSSSAAGIASGRRAADNARLGHRSLGDARRSLGSG